MLVGIDASRAVDPAPTGTETYSRELIRALLALDRENHYRLYTRKDLSREFFCAAPVIASTFVSLSVNSAEQSPSYKEFASSQQSLLAMTQANFEIRAMPFPRAWTHVRLSIEMLKQSPDILWVPAHVLPLVHPHRSIVTIHDLGQLFFPEAYPLGTRWYHNVSARWNAHAAAHVFADSESTKDDVVRFLGIASEKISVVHPAYDASLFQPLRDQDKVEKIKARFRLVGDYILTIGTIHPRKNYARLFNAIERLKDLKLVVVGKRGWLYREILDSMKNLESRVQFLDYVPASDLAALVSGARLFVFPSLHEGFGLPILEAQACGVPVVCSKSSSLFEAAGDGALFFDPLSVDAMADAIQRGWTDQGLRAELISRGFENVKRFSWEKSARQVYDVLTRVLAS